MAAKHDIIADFVDRSVEGQSWYRQNANVVNGLVAGLAGALAFLLAYVQASGSWPGAEGLLVFLVPIFSAVALKLTKNGIGESQAAELKRHAAMEDREDSRREVSRQVAPTAPVADTPSTASGLPVYFGSTTAEA